MNSDSILGSSLTFYIEKGKDIQIILQLIRAEAQKENCSESEITLVSTAVSEVCRRFMEFGSLELTLTILSRSEGLELRGKACVQAAHQRTDWKTIMKNIDTYFSETLIGKHDDPTSLSYSFLKRIPREDTIHPKLRSGSGSSVDHLPD